MPVPRSFIKQYGKKKGKQVFYATENKRKKSRKKSFSSQMRKVHKIMSGY